MHQRLWVVGSANLDTVHRVAHLPVPGETVRSKQVAQFLGGKGANQAWAARQVLSSTTFVACVGRDAGGALFQERFDGGLFEVDFPTGSASILVEDSGQNSIVVHSGANEHLSCGLVESLGIEEGEIVLTQLETPMETIETLARLTDQLILNLAPAMVVSHSLLERAYCLILNESEGDTLTRIRPARDKDCFRVIRRLGAKMGILTRGAQGCAALLFGQEFLVPAPSVEVVDTTGAGDAFCGVFAAELALGTNPLQAVRQALVAGSLACTKLGAMDSIPTKDAIDAFRSG